MTTVDQFLKALAVVESSDNPEAWGDAGQAMGRWQVHPDRLWSEAAKWKIAPTLGETWDQFVSRILRAIWVLYSKSKLDEEIAMYWHLGHWTQPGAGDWSAKYEVKFAAALANAQKELT